MSEGLVCLRAAAIARYARKNKAIGKLAGASQRVAPSHHAAVILVFTVLPPLAVVKVPPLLS